MAKRRGRGEGGIEARPDGSLRAWAPQRTVNGKVVRPSKVFAAGQKQAALAWIREQASAAVIDATSGPTIAEYAAGWLLAGKDQWEPATYKWYSANARRHVLPHLGPTRLRALTTADVERWYATLAAAGVSAHERHKAGTTLRAILAPAVRADLIPSSPAAKVRRPTVRRKETEAYTLDQARSILASATPRWAAFVRLALDTGMRPQEYFALEWADVDIPGGSVQVRWALDDTTGERKRPKSPASRRAILIGRPTADAMAAWKGRAGYDPLNPRVFPSRTGGYLQQSNVARQMWAPLCVRAGVPHHGMYSLRHTSATLLLQGGVNIKVVSQRLGHSDIAITLRFYTYALDTMQAHAAEVAGKLFG